MRDSANRLGGGSLGVLAMVPATTLILHLLAAPAGAQCVGDCNGDGAVAINELVLGVNVALEKTDVSACDAMDANSDGVVAINELIQAVNNALRGCDGTPDPTQTSIPTATPTTGPAVEVERVFSVCPDTFLLGDPATTRNGVFNSALPPGLNAASNFGGTITLVMSERDGRGVAQLRVKEDTILWAEILDGSFFCMKVLAEESSGEIDCTGGNGYEGVPGREGNGTGHDVNLTQDPGDVPDDIFDLDLGLGEDAGPGALTLIVKQTLVNTLPGEDCFATEYKPPVDWAYTTATGTAFKGEAALTVSGENFDCDSFGTEDGPGMLILPAAQWNVAGGGDVAAVLRLSDKCE